MLQEVLYSKLAVIAFAAAAMVILGSARPATAGSGSWSQDGGNAQRTGYTPENPDVGDNGRWQFLWGWNGPNSTPGTTDAYLFDQAELSDEMREARPIVGGGQLYSPGGSKGLFAVDLASGVQKWNFTGADINATPAYDHASGFVYAPGEDGKLYKLNASDGSVAGTYNAGGGLNKSVLIGNDSIFVVTDTGDLHQVNKNTMVSDWASPYSAGSDVATLPSFSASANAVVYATMDDNVHAVDAGTGAEKWKVNPVPAEAHPNDTFQGGTPVIAERNGIVFVRTEPEDLDVFQSGPLEPGGRWPETMAETKQYLIDNPEYQNLFALDVHTGQQAFLPVVGPGFTEGWDGSPDTAMGTQPVVKTLRNGEEVVYMFVRTGQNPGSQFMDGRWDATLGEMVLNDNTIDGLAAGEFRLTEFEEEVKPGQATGVITDEQNPLNVAGDTVFHSHWAFVDIAVITDRSESLTGDTFDNAIEMENLPSITRRHSGDLADADPTTHFITENLTLDNDTRLRNGPGFWAYFFQEGDGIAQGDPSANPRAGGFSGGEAPRYAIVSDGYVIIVGNGGDIMTFQHFGEVIPEPGTFAILGGFGLLGLIRRRPRPARSY